MVDAVVSSVVQRLGNLLIEPVNFLRGVKDEVNSLRTKLDYMLCFLKDAEEKQVENSSIRKWVSDIRDVAYDAEDTIDKFILKVEEEGISKKAGFKACLKKYLGIYKLANMYGIGKEIEELKNRLDEIDRNRKAFNITELNAVGETSSMNKKFKHLRRTTSFEDDDYVVGFKNDEELLMLGLLEPVPHRLVLSIVGMGGLGKTTIARKIYKNSSVREKFDCCAWVSTSQDYDIEDLLRRTIKSFKRSDIEKEFETLQKMEIEDLDFCLHEFLKESRYLLVIDDVWDTNVWASLRKALPNNKNGSRIIITTRKKEVAKSASSERKYICELPFLKKEESWELFFKVFSNYDGIDDNSSNFPPNLKELAKDMVEKCNGLPLAIVVLGGFLSRKDLDDWPKLKDHIWKHVTGDNFESREFAHVWQILALSFNDLSHHLKSCFLYFGLFPEDFEINANKLLQLWVAEGFIQLRNGEALEEIAAEYLNELIDRNLIQVAKRNWRRIRNCRVHDLLRDFAIEKSKELNFLHVCDGNDNSTLSPSRCRRLASHNGGLKRFDSFDHSSNLHLRTLLFFNLENESAEIAKLQSLYTKLRLLRVLDLDKITFNPSEETKQVRLPDTIGKLIHLRYLALSGTDINELPPSIGNLQALQTLRCNSNFSKPIILPDTICNAKQLRHLIGHFKWPFHVENLTNLRSLWYCMVDDKMEFNPLMDLINLRELYVLFNGESKGFTLDSIGRLKSLQTLLLCEFKKTGWFPTLQPLSHCQHLLQLKLWGKIVKLPTEMHEFLPNLKYLFLDGSGMEEDPMQSLEKLPKLTILDLRRYSGEKLVCTARGFPQLEILQLIHCYYVKELKLDEGAMPVLRGLNVGSYVSVPERLRSIPRPKNWKFPYDNDWPY